MKKDRANKLDGFAERLDGWEAEGKTLAEMQAQLKLDGCSVACSSLSDFLARRRGRRQEEALLGQIASGARQCRDVEAALGSNGAPELETLIKLHRVLILKLSAAGAMNPELLDLVNRMMKPVVQFARLQQMGAQIDLDRRRVALLEEAAERARKTEQVLESGISPEEQASRIRDIFKRT